MSKQREERDGVQHQDDVAEQRSNDFFESRTKLKTSHATANGIARFNVGGKIFCTTRETLMNSTMYSTCNRPRSTPNGLSLEGGDITQFLASSASTNQSQSVHAHNFFTKLIEGGDFNDFVLKVRIV